MKNKKILRLSLCALFSAVIAASAFISVPTPFGISFTMQIFGVSLAGFCLGVGGGVAATAVYIAVGAMGLPVFSSFSGGVGVLLGPSGGFLWGFIFVAALCAWAVKSAKKHTRLALCAISVLLCHTLGVAQYALVSGVSLWVAILTASLPFLLKDFIVVFFSLLTAQKVNKALKG